MTVTTRPPAYQTYANDLLALFTGFSLTAFGAAQRLFFVMWGQSPDQCSLIDDDAMLARTVGVSIEEWKQLRQEIQHPGRPIFEEKDGRLVSAHLLEERKKQAAWRKKSKQGGIQSGKTRALKAQTERRVVQGSLDNGSPLVRTKGQPKANTPTPSPIPEEEKKERVCAHAVSSLADKNDAPEQTATTHGLNGHARQGWEVGSQKFIAAYPRKEQRDEVEQWFRVHHPSAEVVDHMVATLTALKLTERWQEKGGHFIPAPLKWLKGKRWEDDPKIDLPVKRPRLAL